MTKHPPVTPWRSLTVANCLTLGLAVAHVLEEQVRAPLPLQAWATLAPVLLALAIGTAAASVHSRVGLGLSIGANLSLAVAAGVSHLWPASPDYAGRIADAWGGPLGLLWATVAVLLWAAALGALALGVAAAVRVASRHEERPFAA
ncbi:MAG TPA: hypothetical protein VNZ52_06335 [Candidatus Thermoplasmatota archaeon]|nr:hypothetical protein [Candidatus Thermoplasmatota archaeon]